MACGALSYPREPGAGEPRRAEKSRERLLVRGAVSRADDLQVQTMARTRNEARQATARIHVSSLMKCSAGPESPRENSGREIKQGARSNGGRAGRWSGRLDATPAILRLTDAPTLIALQGRPRLFDRAGFNALRGIAGLGPGGAAGLNPCQHSLELGSAFVVGGNTAAWTTAE